MGIDVPMSGSEGVPLAERQLSTNTTLRRSRMPIETEALQWSASSFMYGRAIWRALMLARSGYPMDSTAEPSWYLPRRILWRRYPSLVSV